MQHATWARRLPGRLPVLSPRGDVVMHSNWSKRASSCTWVVTHARSGRPVFVHGAPAPPLPLLEALAAGPALEGARVVHLHIEGTAPHAAPGKESAFRAVSLFTSAPLREALAAG